MPFIQASDITVVITEVVFERRKKTVRGTLSFGNGVDMLPPDGLPRPTLTQLSLIRQLDELRLYPDDGSTPQTVEYQQTDNKILFPGALSEQLADGTLQGGSDGEIPLKTTLRFVAVRW